MTNIDRREILSLFGGGAALALPGRTVAAGKAEPVRFLHGVASGDPARDGAVLWTRATPAEGSSADVDLRWHVATSADGGAQRSGHVTARAARDFTAKVEAGGLAPGRDHWFWFESADGTLSPRGRFRTLPAGAAARIVFGVASCQLYPGGLWNAYDALAKEPQLDAIIHLGDYIYEYGETGYGGEIGRRLGRLPEPAHEIVTLADYRARHAQAKRDPDMQAAHARAAFICVWDDHETANDSWVGGAENHDPATEGDWSARKAAAMQAYFEWMPIRDPKPGQPWEAINRSFEFGDLATLVMVETRLLRRSRQVAPKGAAIDPADYAPMLAERALPDRELLGPDQQAWVEQRLTASVAAGKPWQVIGNQIIMARVPGPDLAAQLGPDRYARLLATMTPSQAAQVTRAAASYKAGLPFNLDSWDGYPAARERLYAAFARAGSRPLVLSGDSHAAWANDLHDASGRLAAAEFGATAITSPSYGSVLPGFGAQLMRAGPEVRFCDQDDKGYLLLTLTPGAAEARFVTVSTVFAKPYTVRTKAVGRVTTDKAAPLTISRPA